MDNNRKKLNKMMKSVFVENKTKSVFSIPRSFSLQPHINILLG